MVNSSKVRNGVGVATSVYSDPEVAVGVAVEVGVLGVEVGSGVLVGVRAAMGVGVGVGASVDAGAQADKIRLTTKNTIGERFIVSTLLRQSGRPTTRA